MLGRSALTSRPPFPPLRALVDTDRHFGLKPSWLTLLNGHMFLTEFVSEDTVNQRPIHENCFDEGGRCGGGGAGGGSIPSTPSLSVRPRRVPWYVLTLKPPPLAGIVDILNVMSRPFCVSSCRLYDPAIYFTRCGETEPRAQTSFSWCRSCQP